MTKSRADLVDALVIATLGAATYLVLAAALHGILGVFPETLGCFLGAAASAYLVGIPLDRRIGSSVLASLKIVAATFLAIAVTHTIARLVRGVPTTWEPVVLLYWAVVATSWWLVPGTAAVLLLLQRRRASPT
jgi:hypothetical protein